MPTVPNIDHFLETNTTPEPNTGCWLWTGTFNHYNYGVVRLGGPTLFMAHRVVWESIRGHIPAGFYICHHCDNRACVNPSHLFMGTQTDNMRDAQRKGRVRRGEQHWGAKVSEADVREILARLGRGERQRKIAAHFGLDPSTVSNIATGKRWRHVRSSIRRSVAA